METTGQERRNAIAASQDKLSMGPIQELQERWRRYFEDLPLDSAEHSIEHPHLNVKRGSHQLSDASTPEEGPSSKQMSYIRKDPTDTIEGDTPNLASQGNEAQVNSQYSREEHSQQKDKYLASFIETLHQEGRSKSSELVLDKGLSSLLNVQQNPGNLIAGSSDACKLNSPHSPLRADHAHTSSLGQTGGSRHEETVFKPNVAVQQGPAITSHIPQSVKEKIWRGDYVEMFDLIDADGIQHIVDSDVPGAKDLLSAFAALSKHPPKNFRSKSWDNWTLGFIYFMAVVIEKEPSQALPLLSYFLIIREAYFIRGGLAWLWYDQKFRKLKAVLKHLRWDEQHTNTWLGVMIDKPKMLSHTIESQVASNPNVCWAFNAGNCEWPACRFSHICSHCGDNHAAVKCWIKDGSKGTSLGCSPDVNLQTL
ncbi:uncharacterized protein LOC122796503 isoform X1 [Protopterus annectens]|uniref:uncharacterized protein LOC122796503 isoform X1 n=1 Tax=Protopterus annectens TaxID=7888 RepID=UPI001CFAD711|nr:uncharacterized protein LOC122796503 isoform X1 [Protopterus annectens]